VDLARAHRARARDRERVRPPDHRARFCADHVPYARVVPLRYQRAHAPARGCAPIPRVPGERHHPRLRRRDRDRDRGHAPFVDPARLTEATQPDFVVVTGLSGSGKSQAVKVLEDLGYYTLDNLPPALMATALEVSRKGGKRKVAFVIDAR